MILLDTHIWVWWVSDISKLSAGSIDVISKSENSGLCISIISLWEVTKLVEKKKLAFDVSLQEWIDKATLYPGIRVIDLSKEIILHTAQLKDFHKDPADQLIVSTSIVNRIPLLTKDVRILNFDFVETIRTD